jgi:hypothetical protein
MKDRNVKQVQAGEGTNGKVGGSKRRMKAGKYGGCMLYSCMKVEQWNLLKLF